MIRVSHICRPRLLIPRHSRWYHYENVSSSLSNTAEVPESQVLSKTESCKNIATMSVSVDVPHVNVEVFPTWDEVSSAVLYVPHDSSSPTGAHRQASLENVVQDTTQSVAVHTHGPTCDPMCLRVLIPQRCNLTVNNTGGVAVHDKVEGDVLIHSTDGDITVSKVRGDAIELVAKQGSVDVSVLEATKSIISAESFAAKRVLTKDTRITTNHDTHVASLYTSQSSVQSRHGKVQVDSIHGSGIFKSEGGDVVVGGVNGSIVCESNSGSISVKFDGIRAGETAELKSLRGNVDASLPTDFSCLTSLGGVCKALTLDGEPTEWRVEEVTSDVVEFKGTVLPGKTRKPQRGAGSGKVNVNAIHESRSPELNTASKLGATSWRLNVHAPEGHLVLRKASWIDSIMGGMKLRGSKAGAR